MHFFVCVTLYKLTHYEGEQFKTAPIIIIIIITRLLIVVVVVVSKVKPRRIIQHPLEFFFLFRFSLGKIDRLSFLSFFPLVCTKLSLVYTTKYLTNKNNNNLALIVVIKLFLCHHFSLDSLSFF